MAACGNKNKLVHSIKLDGLAGIIEPVAFMGDSIAEGYGMLPENSCWNVFRRTTGIEVIRTGYSNPVAFPGIGVKEFAGRIDHLMKKWQPKTVFLSIGANNFDDSCTASYPYGTNIDEIFFHIKRIIDCMVKNGAIPFWMGLPPFEECGAAQDKPRKFNFLVSECLESRNLPSFFYIDRMMKDKSWDAMGGHFFNNLATDKHPNESGHRLIAEVCAEALAAFHKIAL